MSCVIFKDTFFMQTRLQFSVKNFDIFSVGPLCELQLVTALDANDIRHHPHWNSATDMAISLLES